MRDPNDRRADDPLQNDSVAQGLGGFLAYPVGTVLTDLVPPRTQTDWRIWLLLGMLSLIILAIAWKRHDVRFATFVFLWGTGIAAFCVGVGFPMYVAWQQPNLLFGSASLLCLVYAGYGIAALMAVRNTNQDTERN
jgi:FtsH-binding integral membrane protein